MPKCASADLQELIHSLHTGEIIYFKKYAKRHSDKESLYAQLFDCIKLTKNCNEEIIMQLHGMDSKQRLAEQKVYLYKLMLESLTSYHKSKKIDFEVREMITQAIILMNKKLYEQSLKIIMKAKELAVHHKLSYAINEILSIEAMLSLEIFDLDDFSKEYKKLFSDYEYSAKKIQHIGLLLKIRCLINGMYFKYGTLVHLFDDDLLAYCAAEMNKIDREKLMLLEQLIYDSNTLDMLTFSVAGYDLYQSISERLIFTYETNATLIEQHTHNYINVLAQAASQNLIHNNQLSYIRNIAALKKLSSGNSLFDEHHLRLKINTPVYYMGMICSLKQGRDEEAYAGVQGTLFLQLNKRTQLQNFYIAGIACFYHKKYTEALSCFDVVFNQSSNRLDLQLLCRMYEIACHLELNNHMLVSHKLIALNRYHKKLSISLQQVNSFTKFIKLHIDPSALYKNKKLSNHYEMQLIALCKNESLNKYDLEIALYAIMKNSQLNFSDALDYYNCNVTTLQSSALQEENQTHLQRSMF